MTLLYQGRQIYFGPASEAKQYFTELGYHCPDRQTTADFLTSLTNPAERIARAGFENIVPRTPDEFADVWKASQARVRLMSEISDFEAEYSINGPEVEKLIAARKAQQSKLM